jgi:hypothetical protein
MILITQKRIGFQNQILITHFYKLLSVSAKYIGGKLLSSVSNLIAHKSSGR